MGTVAPCRAGPKGPALAWPLRRGGHPRAQPRWLDGCRSPRDRCFFLLSRTRIWSVRRGRLQDRGTIGRVQAGAWQRGASAGSIPEPCARAVEKRERSGGAIVRRGREGWLPQVAVPSGRAAGRAPPARRRRRRRSARQYGGAGVSPLPDLEPRPGRAGLQVRGVCVRRAAWFSRRARNPPRRACTGGR